MLTSVTWVSFCSYMGLPVLRKYASHTSDLNVEEDLVRDLLQIIGGPGQRQQRAQQEREEPQAPHVFF